MKNYLIILLVLCPLLLFGQKIDKNIIQDSIELFDGLHIDKIHEMIFDKKKMFSSHLDKTFVYFENQLYSFNQLKDTLSIIDKSQYSIRIYDLKYKGEIYKIDGCIESLIVIEAREEIQRLKDDNNR